MAAEPFRKLGDPPSVVMPLLPYPFILVLTVL